ncbi:MAG: hypothetical protein IPN71_03810 [Fibrobacteres bacterium]|nr:hypothetical protein [Fibrobacterota bacterium]
MNLKTDKTLRAISVSETEDEWVVNLDAQSTPEAWLCLSLLRRANLSLLTLGEKSQKRITLSSSPAKSRINFIRVSEFHANANIPNEQLEYVLYFLLEAVCRGIPSTHVHFTGQEDGREKDLTFVYSRAHVSEPPKTYAEILVDLIQIDPLNLFELIPAQIPEFSFAISQLLFTPKRTLRITDKRSNLFLDIASATNTNDMTIKIEEQLLREAQSKLLSIYTSNDLWPENFILMGMKDGNPIEIEILVKQ